LSTDSKEPQKGLIITDNFSEQPILDFESYSDAIVKMIKNSDPNFTIGIFGEWGTGKTTLMKLIEKKIGKNDQDIITVWFDAWKYENEKEFALIPLLKVIDYSIPDEADERKRKLKDALKEAAIFTLGVSTNIVSSLVSNYAGKEVGGLLRKSLDSAAQKLIPQLQGLKKLSDIDSKSIFYNGIKNIQEAIYQIQEKKSGFRIVVFIDDLDRCSEDKILEVLESIKIFLSLNGIIYVLRISHDRVVELINKKYQTSNGEQYLKKFIQIPLILTEWNDQEIVNLIDHLLKNNIHDDYKPIVDDYKEIIASAIEVNPRETKRFLNNLIISYEVFVKIQDLQDEMKKKLFLKQLLLVQILNSSWRDLYRAIISPEGNFLKRIKRFLPLDTNKVQALLSNKDSQIDSDLKNIFEKYKSNVKIWNFLNSSNLDVLDKVLDWNTFRRALRLTEEKSLTGALQLLRAGKVEEFNRTKKEFSVLDLRGADLTGSNLSNADLRGVNLSGADLNGTILTRANLRDSDLRAAEFRGADLYEATLSGANLANALLTGAFLSLAALRGADLSGASLIGANLTQADLRDANLTTTKVTGANLTGANLTGANLTGANLTGANLTGANLTGANLTKAELVQTDLTAANLTSANLSKSLIINLKKFESVIVNDKTALDDSIIDDSDFIDHVKGFIKNVPAKITDRKKLELKLEAGGYSKGGIEYVLRLSKLQQ